MGRDRSVTSPISCHTEELVREESLAVAEAAKYRANNVKPSDGGSCGLPKVHVLFQYTIHIYMYAHYTHSI